MPQRAKVYCYRLKGCGFDSSFIMLFLLEHCLLKWIDDPSVAVLKNTFEFYLFINESNEVSEENLMLWSEKFLRIVFKMSVGKTWLNCRDRNRSTTILTKLSDVWSLKINSQQLHDFVLNYFDVNKLNNINCMVFH